MALVTRVVLITHTAGGTKMFAHDYMKQKDELRSFTECITAKNVNIVMLTEHEKEDIYFYLV